MIYLSLFLEGIITFISPCLLPLLPIYVTYFAAGESEGKSKPFVNAVGFVLGFTVVFVALGAFAGTVGGFLVRYGFWVNIFTGLVVVFFGLNYLGVLRLNFLRSPKQSGFKVGSGKPLNFPSAVTFGVVFSVAYSPCISTFLGAALMRAAGQGTTLEGMAMLFVYSMGLGIPFILSAIMLDSLKGVFVFIKNNFRIVNIIAGVLLIVMGILMMIGWFNWN
jgi:cytochrome c-type biogenesis protein